jgi:hypothetical protein
MKYKLPSLTGAMSLTFLLLLAPSFLLILAPSITADDGAAFSDSEDLLTAAATNLARLPAIEAKLRQRVSLFGHEMVGSGTYQQMTAGRQRMLRLELKMDVAGRVASFQQISDGTTMWIRRDSKNEKRLDYINLRHIRQALAKQANAPQFSPTSNWFALGGLDQLLHELNRNFDFDKPIPGEIGSVPVWELKGTWKPTALERFGVRTAEELPAHFPHVVKLTLGRDEHLPLFPYRIEYGRYARQSEADPSSSESSTYVAIAAMDLHGVQRRPDLAARHFRFQPNDQEVVDVTELYLDRLMARDQPKTATGDR